MVVILGYNRSETVYLNKILDNSNIEYSYSLIEKHIINADKIILPHPQNFNSSYRKLSMMNLFSMMRLLKKPILGINDGSKLMCNQLNDVKCGLGFFNIDKEIGSVECDNENFIKAKLKELSNSKLLPQTYLDSEVFICKNLKPNICMYTTFAASFSGEKYSVLNEYKNYFGVELNIDKNYQILETIISKFCKL